MSTEKKHEAVEEEERSQYCRICNKAFSSLRDLDRHNCSFNRIDGEDSPSTSSQPRKKRCLDLWSPITTSPPLPLPLPPPRLPPPRLSLTEEDEDLAHFLVYISHLKARNLAASKANDEPPPPPPATYFNCKSCGKVFAKHQALGGHRASHKKVKGCFAASEQMAPAEPSNPNKASSSSDVSLPRKKAKLHECSICNRQFPSGQALGGHKRCHWITSSRPEHVVVAEPDVAPAAVEPMLINWMDGSLDMEGNVAPREELLGNVCLQLGWGEEEERKEGVIDEADSEEVIRNKLREMKQGDEYSKWLQLGTGHGGMDYN